MDADAPLDAVRRELRLLRHVVVVAEELHVGRAARRLHMTQPPLTQAVRRLERELAVELLTREADVRRLREGGAHLTLATFADVVQDDALAVRPVLPPASDAVCLLTRPGAWPRCARRRGRSPRPEGRRPYPPAAAANRSAARRARAAADLDRPRGGASARAATRHPRRSAVPDDAQEQVLDAERRWNATYLARDVEAFAALIAPDFAYVSERGRFDRPTYVEDLRSGVRPPA